MGPTNAEYYPFQEITSAKMTDKTDDRVASGKDDVNTKKMGAKGDVTTADRSEGILDQSKEILMYLKAGG